MDAEDLAFDDGTNAEVVEDFSAVFPRVGISVLSDGLIVETVHSGDLSCFVVTSQKSDVGGVLHFEAQEELEGLNRVESSVDEVAHEDVSRVGNLSTLVEELKKIVELAMDVSADGDWGFDWLHVALFDENLLNLLAEDSEISFRKDLTALDGFKPVVDVGRTHLFCLQIN